GKEYNLTREPQSSNEIYWKTSIPNEDFKDGINYLDRILTFPESDYEVPTQNEFRAFYKNPPSNNERNRDKDSSSPEKIDLVYIVTENDILNISDTQTITLDAKSNRRISDVYVYLV